MNIPKLYHYYFTELADKRVMDMPLMANPFGVFAILAAYLLIVLKFGPKFMENRKPYEFKKILAIYNIFQVVSCIYLVYTCVRLNPTVLKFWCCNDVDTSNSPRALQMIDLAYLTMMVKFCELLETVFFVLRKKDSQVSALHLYHHTSTALLAWTFVKYSPGGMAMFTVILNSFVHVVMYSYYAVALLGLDYQKKMLPIKKSITKLQMIQFCFILLNAFTGYIRSCKVPKFLLLCYIPNIVFIFYMFFNFYKNAYLKKSKKTQ